MSGRTGDLTRAVKLWISANGIVRIAPSMPRGFLPLFSADTLQDATDLCVMVCKYDRHEGYFVPMSETPSLADLEQAVVAFRRAFDRLRVEVAA